MKRLALMFILVICLVSVPFTATPHGDGKPQKGKRVFCCYGKGKCDNLHTKADCEKEGGKVVTSCKECK
ncbi:MAG: hypothetical protein RDU20_18260 [Desulfomonilaceae bacterium]|nr:hypothetical protein [Desulfomonilaceae bacterium]